MEKGIQEEKIKILYPGVDVDYFSPAKGKEEIGEIKKTYCDSDTSLIVNVARLFPVKNHIRIIKAISSIVKKGKQIKCVFAGDGPELEKLDTK